MAGERRARRAWRRHRGRLADGLIVAGGTIASVGAFMPWLQGPTRMRGTLDWSGLSDSGEGVMFIAGFLGLLGWMRWRSTLVEIAGRARWIPVVVATACVLLWVIAARKIWALSYWEIAVGARPQEGLFVSGLGLLLMLGGSLLAATDPAIVAAARAMQEREKRRSGAGGVGAASGRVRRGGGGRPPDPDEYSVRSRVNRD